LFGFSPVIFATPDRLLVTILSITGVSMPHYRLGMVLVIISRCSSAGCPRSAPVPRLGVGLGALSTVLPAVTMSVIPMGIVARTVRALVGDLLSQEFVTALRAKGLTELRVFAHVAKNAAPTAIAVMGLQFGYLLGGSILIETVFSWPGTGFLLNSAIFQRDLPLLQGTILVLALFFVFLNLVVDVIQAAIDPRIKRA
jgi:peptide/nickel transport system permease protein